MITFTINKNKIRNRRGKTTKYVDVQKRLCCSDDLFLFLQTYYSMTMTMVYYAIFHIKIELFFSSSSTIIFFLVLYFKVRAKANVDKKNKKLK